MVRRVFFSFHFQRDHWRVNQVRNAWVTQDREAAGYEDAAEWEEVKKQSDEEIKKWIDDQLHGTSVTAVLIGSETASRKYVRYEIEKSIRRGNGVVGIRVHRVKNKHGNADPAGQNPLDDFVVETEDGTEALSDVFETYDWNLGDGRQNIGEWVEEAKNRAGQLSYEERKSIREKQEEESGVNWGGLLKLGVALGVGYKIVKDSLDHNSQSNKPNGGNRNYGDIQDAVSSDDPWDVVQDAVRSGGLDTSLYDDDSEDDRTL